MKKQKENWLITLWIIESIALICALVMVGRVRNLDASRDTDNPDFYAKIRNFPDKVVYVAGVDTELDLRGCTISESRLFGADDGTAEDLVSNLGTHFTVVSEDIDFSTPGVYEVRIRGYDTECAFPIEVIDPAALE